MVTSWCTAEHCAVCIKIIVVLAMHKDAGVHECTTHCSHRHLKAGASNILSADELSD